LSDGGVAAADVDIVEGERGWSQNDHHRAYGVRWEVFDDATVFDERWTLATESVCGTMGVER
jgi:hypothetical protein